MPKLLDSINNTKDLKKLTIAQLTPLAEEIREYMMESLADQGGHLGANLGVVELTLALHYVLNSPTDKIVWDVSHQCYTHKILTGRKEGLPTIRQENGLLGFTSITESPHDHFTVGHASTSLSQALGLAIARDLSKEDSKIVAITGDGALTGGLCYEAMNNMGHLKKDMLVVLNDNELSIAKNVGSISKYLNRILTNPIYNRLRREVEEKVKRFPRLTKFLKNMEESAKNILVPGIVFEELGIRYFGPVDGHDIPNLIKTFKNILTLEGPCLLHVVTKKAKGIDFGKDEPPASFHSYGPYSFEKKADQTFTIAPKGKKKEQIPYTNAFAKSMIKLAEKDPKIVGITAAMPAGTGLLGFQKKFPDRFFDVGIAEGHAVTCAGGLSRGGMKPVCAIYSTFLQRGFDHLIHDGALQNANITVCMDRAGLCGPDGPSHHGMYDFAYLRVVPGSVVAAPRDEAEMLRMLELGVNYQGVFGIRYPKENILHYPDQLNLDFEIGEGEILCEGKDLAILSLGSTIENALETATLLKKQGIDAGVFNMRFAKPLDEKLLSHIFSSYDFVITIEEHVKSGGFGSAILQSEAALNNRHVSVQLFSFPDQFIEHGSRKFLFNKFGLTPEKVAASLTQEFQGLLDEAKK